MRRIKTGEGEGGVREMKRSREEKGGKKKKEETINFKFFPVVRYLESYMYVIIFCIRLLSMEGSIGCQITRGYQ